jgi:hypothetical protein
MRSLLWKEWHEQSWKLAFSCILLSAMAAIGLHTRIISDEDLMMWICLIGLLLPVSYASGLLPAERSDGFFEPLIALPIAPWKILAVKTVVGLLQCVVPIMVAMLISVLWFGGREIESASIIALYGRAAFAAILLFMWILALTSQLPSEVRAGLLGVGILICWLMIDLGLGESSYANFTAAISPIGFVVQHTPRRESPAWKTAFVVQSIVAVLLWWWTSRRISVSVEA